MDDPSLLPFLNTNDNGNGHFYSVHMDDEIEHEEDELDDDEVDEDEQEDIEDDDALQNYDQIQQYPEDEIEEDEIEEDDIDDQENQDEQEISMSDIAPPPPPPPPPQTIQSERGGRRKGVPRRLQVSPQDTEVTSQQRLLPGSVSKSASHVHHHDQPLLISDQEDVNNDFHNENHIGDYFNDKQQHSLQLDLLTKDIVENSFPEYDENNNYNDDENILEIVDDILADIVTIIVRDVRQQRQKSFKQQVYIIKTNGYSTHKPVTNGLSKSTAKQEQKVTNGKQNLNGSIQTNSVKSSKFQSQQSLPSLKSNDSASLFNEFTKMMHLNSPQQSVKQKHSLSSSSFSSPPSAKRQKTSDTLSTSQPPTPSSLQQQHQQLLWQMTQQLMMSAQPTDSDTSSLLKQQLLGLAAPATIPKRVGRPPKHATQPQIMRSSTNMIPPTSHSSMNTSSYERGNFAPRRRGRPPKYVTERGILPSLPAHDLDPSSYDQLFAAIENSVTGNSSRTPSAAFQSALASMLGHQPSLSIPPTISAPAIRNGAPASMVKQSAGQTRHSLPGTSNSSKLSHMASSGNGLDMPLIAAKKRGPGRPPKSHMLLDSHQLLHATKRTNSSSTLSNPNHNSFPPTMVPSSPPSFSLNAAFADILQQQHSH